jgi:hypothetical protein
MSFEADQLEGFRELLETSGGQFIHPSGEFRGLVKQMTPENEAFDLTPGDDDRVQVSGLKTEVPAEVVKVGASFTDSEDYSYRVTAIRRSPNHVAVRLECEVVKP